MKDVPCQSCLSLEIHTLYGSLKKLTVMIEVVYGANGASGLIVMKKRKVYGACFSILTALILRVMHEGSKCVLQ